MSKFNYFPYKEKRLLKLSFQEQEDLIFDLINAFTWVNNPSDSALLVQDLLTEKEILNLSKRLRIAKLILGNKPHEEIVRDLHCSFATVAKVNSWLENAGEGLRKVIANLPKRRKIYKPKRIPGIGYGLPQILLHLGSAHLSKKERQVLEKFTQQVQTKSNVDKEFRKEANKLK